MYASKSNIKAISAYSTTSVQTDVLSASPHKLVLMLFDGALFALSRSKFAIENKILDEKIKQIAKAIDIISLGLKASLDTSIGGELASRLDALYDYMCARIAFSNATNTTAPIDEVVSLLRDLRDAWAAIDEAKQVTPSNSYEEA